MVSVWSKVQTCIWPRWCHCHSLSLAPVKSRLVLPFWYRLTWVVPEKGPLNVCSYTCTRTHPFSTCHRCLSSDVISVRSTYKEICDIVNRKTGVILTRGIMCCDFCVFWFTLPFSLCSAGLSCDSIAGQVTDMPGQPTKQKSRLADSEVKLFLNVEIGLANQLILLTVRWLRCRQVHCDVVTCA